MMELTAENATHLLRCVHAIGRSRRNYVMCCHILKEMPDRSRLKILVFGSRDRRYSEHRGHIRYVDKYKVRKRQ